MRQKRQYSRPLGGGMEEIAEIFRRPTRVRRNRSIGIELERIGMWPNGDALHYHEYATKEGVRHGAEQLLLDLHETTGWPVVLSALKRPIGIASSEGKVSLEPGSQLELSTEPLPHIDALVESSCFYERQVNKITGPWGLKWIGLGLNPTNRVDEIDVIPAPRYHYMTDYLGKRGRLATRMMRLTSSVQINLDYQSEEEGMEMLRAGLLLAPLSYALFGNSPFSEGKRSEFLSARGEIWQQTDPDRTGLLSAVFEDSFNFDSYAKLVWECPLMFAQDEQGEYVPANGLSLADISKGKLPGAIVDGNNRMNAIREIFTEARLKPGYVEIRSVDGQRPDMRFASTAFWVGVLYSAPARQWVLENIGKIPSENRDRWMDEAIRHGLEAKVSGIDTAGIAQTVFSLAREGLIERAFGEAQYLKPLEAMIKARTNPAQVVLKKFETQWQGNWSKLVEYCSVCTEETR